MEVGAVPTNDWRRQYVVCEHVAALPNGDDGGPPTDGLRHRQFDVCCEACYMAGFLNNAELQVTTQANGLAVGRLAAGSQ